MIGCDRLYVHIQWVQASFAHANTWVKLDEPSMYRHGLRTLETERSNVTHIVVMINMEMFTIEDYPSHMMIGHGLVDLDHVSLR